MAQQETGGLVSIRNTVKVVEDVDFNPLWDYCLLESIKQEKTQGGIVLPDTAKPGDAVKAICIKAGSGAYRDNGTLVPNPIKPGDIVYYMGRMQALKLALNGKNYLVVSGRDCVGTGRG